MRDALNEGRGVHPGDTRKVILKAATAASLNEGRGVHPGDTTGGRCGRGG